MEKTEHKNLMLLSLLRMRLSKVIKKNDLKVFAQELVPKGILPLAQVGEGG